jgi:hypothetical protein
VKSDLKRFEENRLSRILTMSSLVIDKMAMKVMLMQMNMSLQAAQIRDIYNHERNHVLNTEDNLTTLKHNAGALFCNANKVFRQELREAESLVFTIMNETFATQNFQLDC